MLAICLNAAAEEVCCRNPTHRWPWQISMIVRSFIENHVKHEKTLVGTSGRLH
jgi:hypothetical protein